MDDNLRSRLRTVRRLATAGSVVLASLLALWFVMPGAASTAAASAAPAPAQCQCPGHASTMSGDFRVPRLSPEPI